MRIKSFAYSELSGTDREWTLEHFDLAEINLFVGRNASGKSRLLNCIAGLAKLVVAPPRNLYAPSDWKVTFEHKNHVYELTLAIEPNHVIKEELTIDGVQRLRRDTAGAGSIWAEKLGADLEFQVPEGALVINRRRDAVQHTFLEPLFDWANSVRQYAFGTEFGKTTIYAAPTERSETASDDQLSIAPDRVVELYVDGWTRFGESFDKAILRDFAEVGYDCKSIDALPLSDFSLPNQPHVNAPIATLMGKVPIVLVVQENDLPAPTRQIEMSMGMFRSLALLINVNYSLKSKRATTILVDDIGEGLDFARATSLIKLLIRRCRRRQIQVIMSTNDRFVMNEVPLQYWHVVNRTKNRIEIMDYENSKETFDRFSIIGLSNFDFFSREMYLDKH